MKKTLLLLASAAMLLVGCAKEKFAEPIDGGLTSVTFSASVDGGVATKAAADNDGKGTYVNRCIMEIYFQNQLYKRMEKSMTSGVTTFSNVPVVAGKQYQILFWADCGGEELADKYYTTETEEDNMGLKAVTVNQTAFLTALTAGDNDELDAFFGANDYTVTPSDHNFDITLYRPFAQLNVITTDVADGKTVTSADLLPDKVSVSYKAADVFNVATGAISNSGDEEYIYTYEADVYGTWSSTKTELTLSMDYLLASTEQGAVDVTFKTFNNGDANPVMTHNLTNLPYKRNYRTNVKGDLLTAGGSWTATIDAQWLSPDIVKVVEVADIKSANEIIEHYAPTTKQLEVKFTAEPNDSGVPAGEAEGKRAIVTTPIQQDASLSIEVLTPTKELYIGDYKSEYIVLGEDVIKTDANHAVVNVNVPESSSIVKLVINAPSKSVYINGKAVANVGTITDLDAITSQNTLIIEKDQKVKNLTIRQGGLEIHGTVEKAIVPEDHDQIAVRDCENLNETDVYTVLKDHIAEGYVGVKGRTTADLWDIVPAPFRVQKEGESTYSYFYSIAEAISAVGDNGTATITVMADHNFSFGVATFATVKAGQTITLDLNGKKIVSGSTLGSGSQAIENKGTLTIVDTNNGEGSWAHGASPSWIYDGSGSYVGSYVSNFITNRGTLYLNGGKLENLSSGSASYVADNFENSKITINGGIFNAASTAFRLFYGTVEMTVNGGIITAGGYDIAQFTGNGSANNLIINGGEFTSDTDFNVYSWGETEGNHSTLKVTGGTFNQWVALSSKFNQIGNSVSGGKFYGAYNYGVGKFISGGVFEAEPYDDFVADGYAVVANTDPATKAKYPYTVKVKPVVKIGNVEYADIADAFAAVPATGTPTTVTLLENIGSKTGDEINWKEYDKTSVYKIKDGQNITFDLNGHKIYAKTTVTGYTCFFEVANGGSLTFMDSAGGGELHYLDGMDNTGGLAIISYGTLIMQSGTVENHTKCNSSAIQGAIDVRANEWGAQYQYHSVFTMNGGVLKSNGDNTLRIYDSSQTGTGSVVVDFTINGGEVYGADAIFIQPQWTKTYSANGIYMNNFNISVTGGKFDTNNGIRVYGAVNETNNQTYRAIQISVTGGEFTIRKPSDKYRDGHIAYQNNGTSTVEATEYLRSYTEVTWTAADPIYCQ